MRSHDTETSALHPKFAREVRKILAPINNLRKRERKLQEQIIRQGGRSRKDQDEDLADVRAEIRAIEKKTEAQAEFA